MRLFNKDKLLVYKHGRYDKEPDYLIGVDLFIPFLRKIKYHRIYDDVICCDVSYLPFRDKSFHTVLASEIIEHLGYNKGMLLINEIERVAKRVAIVTTLNFFTQTRRS